MIMILFVDEISLYFTRPQSNRLKSNNKQAFQLCTARTVWSDAVISPVLVLSSKCIIHMVTQSTNLVWFHSLDVWFRSLDERYTGVMRVLPIDCDQWKAEKN